MHAILPTCIVIQNKNPTQKLSGDFYFFRTVELAFARKQRLLDFGSKPDALM
jgi:hypothetical protein